MVLRATRAYLLVLALGACGESDDKGPRDTPDATQGDRGEGVDAAVDAVIDRPDGPATVTGACADTIDNDGDGLVDLLDPGCEAPEDDDETNIPNRPNCSNGIDDDGDGLPDLSDPNCTGEFDRSERGQGGTPRCSNGIDDDVDGFVDFPNDVDCGAAGDDTEDSDVLGERPVCTNGLDDDGDGATDYPLDPGCEGRGDTNEADPPVAPVCANGLDDDEDGTTDYPDDSGCLAAGDPNEFGACGPRLDALDLNAALDAEGHYDGDLEGGTAVFAGSCGGGSGPERVFLYQLDRRVSALVFSTDHPETPTPTVLYVRRSCLAPADIGCTRGVEATPGVDVRLERPTPGLYFVVVDTSSVALQPGPFRLTVERIEPTACDDGFDNDEDGSLDLNDPGCVNFADTDETDEGSPACGNGLDDDGDGFVDYPDDEDCEAAGSLREQPNCDPRLTLLPVESPGGEFQVNLSRRQSLTTSRCGPGIGVETAVAVNVERASRIHFSALAERNEEVQVSVRRGCSEPDSEIDCNYGQYGRRVAFEFETLGPDTLYFVVEGSTHDGIDPAVSATVRVDIEPLVTFCSDRLDNDADGHVDLVDPGCEGRLDESEDDPAAPPSCADGADGDDDSLVDFPEDLGCMAAGDTDERIVCDFVDPVAVVPAGGGRVRLDLVEDVYDLSCGGAGSDAIVAFVVSAPSEVILRTDLVPGVTVISVLGACEGGAELGCKAGADGGFYTTLALHRLHPGVYFAVVSSTDGLVRSVTLEVEIFPLEPRACADGADNDLDGLIDALDRGCSSSLDDTETDEAVDEAPACANGLDDDGDGWVDHPMDPECQAAGALTEGGRCLDGRPVLEVSQAGGRFSAGFVNLRNVTPLWCEWEPGGELTVALTLESRSRLRVTVANRRGEAVPAAISVRTGCGEVGQPDDEVVCSSPFNDSLNVAELPAGTHFVLIQPTALAGADGYVDFVVESL